MKVFVFLFIICLAGCYSEDGIHQYESLMQEELQSGRREDSLFFGIYLGMTSKEFFTHCWELNKKGIFTDGQNNTAVLYKLDKNQLKYPASMNFYPDFYEDRIYKMRVSFQYDGWAPWNRQRYADTLLPDVLQLFRQWYTKGKPFIKIADKEKGMIYVKVDGNRRITIGRYDDMTVKADYTDVIIERQMKK